MSLRLAGWAALAAAGAMFASGASAAPPTVAVRPGEAVWFLVEGAPAGSCAGRDDRLRAGTVTSAAIEIIYEAASPADCGTPASPATPVARSLVVEGLGAGTYTLTVTGGVALRAEAVRAVT